MSAQATATITSPAKLNLFLYITNKRVDGFHDLQSLFCLMNHGDKMTFTVKDDGLKNFAINDAFDFPLSENLIYKAVDLLWQTTKKDFSVEVNINKLLPMGGGLGGGSSNAATTLLAVNHLLDLKIANEDLCFLGSQLGSDVPFFVKGENAFVEGRGEIITPLKLPTQHYLVVTPQCHVSTKDVFTDPELKNYFSPKRSLDQLMHAPFSNDCVAIVRKKFCEIGHVLDRLVKYGGAAMSGTGASCFTSFPTLEQAQKAQKEIIEDLNLPFTSFVASSTNLSLVHQELAKIPNISAS